MIEALLFVILGLLVWLAVSASRLARLLQLLIKGLGPMRDDPRFKAIIAQHRPKD